MITFFFLARLLWKLPKTTLQYGFETQDVLD